MSLTDIFNSITEETVNQFIVERRQEDLHLDFKTIVKSDMSDKDDKKNFAMAQSGFANSDGGIIVWGIEARKNDQNIDCAIGKRPIKELPLFLSKLNEFTGQFVNPKVNGVQHKTIPISEDSGYAVTVVPKSDSGPHMAKAGEDRYYKRSGSSFYRMEHFDLEDMFGRRKKPILTLHLSIEGGQTSSGPRGKFVHGAIVIGVLNQGRGIAKYPYLDLNINPPLYSISSYGIDGNYNHGLPKIRGIDSKDHKFGGNANIVIHPGQILGITKIDIEIHENTIPNDDIVIEANLMAEGIEPTSDKKTISMKKIFSELTGKNVP